MMSLGWLVHLVDLLKTNLTLCNEKKSSVPLDHAKLHQAQNISSKNR